MLGLKLKQYICQSFLHFLSKSYDLFIFIFSQYADEREAPCLVMLQVRYSSSNLSSHYIIILLYWIYLSFYLIFIFLSLLIVREWKVTKKGKKHRYFLNVWIPYKKGKNKKKNVKWMENINNLVCLDSFRFLSLKTKNNGIFYMRYKNSYI